MADQIQDDASAIVRVLDAEFEHDFYAALRPKELSERTGIEPRRLQRAIDLLIADDRIEKDREYIGGYDLRLSLRGKLKFDEQTGNHANERLRKALLDELAPRYEERQDRPVDSDLLAQKIGSNPNVTCFNLKIMEEDRLVENKELAGAGHVLFRTLLTSRGKALHDSPPRKTLFISCGQSTSAERALGNRIARIVEELTPWTAYFAENQNSLEGVTENILKALRDSVAFIAVMHPRGSVSHSTDPKSGTVVRGSVWIEQEIAIAAFMTQALGRNLPVRAYVHAHISREGLRDKLHLNPVIFAEDQEIIDDLRTFLVNWSPGFSGTETLSVQGRLEEIARKGGRLAIQPLVPPQSSNLDFRIEHVSRDTATLTRVSSAHRIEIPLSHVSEIAPVGRLTIPTMLLNGRVQWLTESNCWAFFTEPPSNPSEREIGFPRNVSMQDQSVIEIERRLSGRGLGVHWTLSEQLTDRLATQAGTAIFYDETGRYLFARRAGIETFILIVYPLR